MTRRRAALSSILVVAALVVAFVLLHRSDRPEGRRVFFPPGPQRLETSVVDDLRVIAAALDAFSRDRNSYPVSGGELPQALEAWLVPSYISRLPDADDWGRPYEYDSDGQRYTLRSLGPDGRPAEAGSATVDDDIVMDWGYLRSVPASHHRERERKRREDLARIARAVKSYSIDNNSYPVAELGALEPLVDLLSPTYMHRLPTRDPDDQDYSYESDGQGFFELRAPGGDRARWWGPGRYGRAPELRIDDSLVEAEEVDRDWSREARTGDLEGTFVIDPDGRRHAAGDYPDLLACDIGAVVALPADTATAAGRTWWLEGHRIELGPTTRDGEKVWSVLSTERVVLPLTALLVGGEVHLSPAGAELRRDPVPALRAGVYELHGNDPEAVPPLGLLVGLGEPLLQAAADLQGERRDLEAWFCGQLALRSARDRERMAEREKLLRCRPVNERHDAMGAIRSIATALESRAIDENRYVRAERVMDVADLAPQLVPTYIKGLPTQDEWGNPLWYRCPGSPCLEYVLVASGRDGRVEDESLRLRQAPGPTHDADADVVFATGSFHRWPERRQANRTPRAHWLEMGRELLPEQHALEETRGRLLRVREAVAHLLLDGRRLPSGIEDLDELAELLEPTYLRRLPRTDAWGRELQLEWEPGGRDVSVSSRGRDGERGPEGACDDPDADLREGP